MTPASDHPTPAVPGRAAFRRLLTHPPLWVILVLAALILGLRRPDMVRNPQFWAEDGWFYAWAYSGGFHTLLQEYAGYLHTVPRLIALAATGIDPRWAPALFVGAAAASTLYVVARTQSQRSPLAGSAVAALAVVLVPDAFEVLLTTCNLQSVISAGLVLILISADPRRWSQWLHDVVAAVLLGLTGPFSVLLAPLFVARAWLRRTRASWILAAAVLGCALIQGCLIVMHPRANPGDAFKPEYLLAVPGLRVGASLLAGAWTPAAPPLWLSTLGGAGTLVAVGWLAGRRGNARAARIAVGVTFLLLLASALHRSRLVLPELCQPGYGARYFFSVQLLAVWLLVFVMREPGRRRAWAVAGVLAWMLLVNLPRLREPAFDDQHWAAYAPKLRAGEAVSIPVNPGWNIPFPARR